MSYNEIWDTQDAFDRYEAIRHRMPRAAFPSGTTQCSGLLEIADMFDAFVLDSFGVLNVGEAAIPGAVACLEQLRARGKHLIVLTNAASYTRETAVRRYRALGFDFAPDEVVSSRDVAASRLKEVLPVGSWGAIAAPEDRFTDIPAKVEHWSGQEVDGFLFLSSAALDADLLASVSTAIRHRKRPVVVANPDLVAPRETGLSKEPGYYAHQLADDLTIAPVYFGKPYTNAFEDAKSRLTGIHPQRIAMVGDTLHTDILGGAVAGFKTVLVRDHGLFAGHATETFISRSGIVPDFSCAGI
ncbi:HAD family hydrolase [uncultured Tateyamaria sp.]|uniref:HAD-IIA family hydrolase n=1 Tax=uncultured Tateyamaria sp. TaxID=455651 RepID=UPI002625AB1C|nr:HAD family hydrolase [uncultured Tateyamaria sp.]